MAKRIHHRQVNLTKIDRDFLLGLYLFLNQTQLSIHRSNWASFSKYFAEQFSIESVILTAGVFVVFIGNWFFNERGVT